MSEPRELTEEEVRNALLDHVWSMIDYWENLSSSADVRDRLEGLAFSILSGLDGGSMAIPKFLVAPDPHPDDKAEREDEGENWFPENHELEVSSDLGGSLHELFSQRDPKRRRAKGSKIYILVADDVDLGHAMASVAHAPMVLQTHAMHANEEKRQAFIDWRDASFKKVVCKVTREQLENSKNRSSSIMCAWITESTLDDKLVAMAFGPLKDWPNFFRKLPLYK